MFREHLPDTKKSILLFSKPSNTVLAREKLYCPGFREIRVFRFPTFPKSSHSQEPRKCPIRQSSRNSFSVASLWESQHLFEKILATNKPALECPMSGMKAGTMSQI